MQNQPEIVRKVFLRLPTDEINVQAQHIKSVSV